MKKYKSIILDVDGTIWNTTGIVADAWNKAIEKRFPQVNRVTAEILKGQFGKTMDIIADNLFAGLNKDEKKQLMEMCCEEEQKALLENTKDISYEGVLEGIKLLGEKVPVCIVSNCQTGYIEVVCEKNQIKEYIKDYECFGNTGKSKGENIRLIIERNALVDPVYVGDTQGDYEACKQAGIPFIWASYGFGNPCGDFDSIKEFSDILKYFD